MITKTHCNLTDEEFERQFASLRLKPGMFSHEAHLRLAHIHIRKYGVKQAELNMCEQIRAFAAHHNGNGFNYTVTVAAVRTLHHFMQRSEGNSFRDLIEKNPRLLSNFKEILSQHYGFNVFSDPKAKKEFVEPDLQPFA